MEKFPLEVVIFQAAFMLLVFGIIGASFVNTRRAKKSWKEFANTHGFHLLGKGMFQDMRMHGIYKGVPVSIYKETRGGGKSKRVYTIYNAKLNSRLPSGLLLFREGLLSKIGKAIGKQDIQVGHSELDKAFIVRGTNPEAVTRFLKIDEVNRALIRLVTYYDSMKLDNGELSLEFSGKIGSHKKLQTALDELVSCAAVLDAHAAKTDNSANPEQLQQVPTHAPTFSAQPLEGSLPSFSSDPLPEFNNPEEDTNNHW